MHDVFPKIKAFWKLSLEYYQDFIWISLNLTKCGNLYFECVYTRNVTCFFRKVYEFVIYSIWTKSWTNHSSYRSVKKSIKMTAVEQLSRFLLRTLHTLRPLRFLYCIWGKREEGAIAWLLLNGTVGPCRHILKIQSSWKPSFVLEVVPLQLRVGPFLTEVYS